MSWVLKPCPFCGASGDSARVNASVMTGGVFCESCIDGSGTIDPELWNERPVEDALRRENERLLANLSAASKHYETDTEALRAENARLSSEAEAAREEARRMEEHIDDILREIRIDADARRQVTDMPMREKP